VQYVVEARYTGEEHELAGAAQQQVVGHKERYIPGVPINYANNDLYQWLTLDRPPFQDSFLLCTCVSIQLDPDAISQTAHLASMFQNVSVVMELQFALMVLFMQTVLLD